MTDNRWAWCEIDLSAIDYNIRQIRKLMQPKTQFMAVIKADAYGHGLVEVARAAYVAGADRFGVATVDEAVKLRLGGVRAPIQILSEPPVTALPLLMEHDIIPTITNRSFFGELSRAAQRAKKVAKYHLKVETGMNRIGFHPHDVVSVLSEARSIPHIELEGVFTHFATADVAGDWDARNQLRTFGEVLRQLEQADITVPIRHCANTAATMLIPESHYDMVRVGIGLYGLHPSEDTVDTVKIEPARTVKAQAIYVKSVAMGEGVGYGLTWSSYKPCDIATLPLGYADGIPRLASNSMEVLYRGKRMEQVGRVCMDQLMVALPANSGVAVGDEFVIVGEQDGAKITLEELSAHAQTINYEMTCRLGQRLEKVYV